MSLIKLQKHKKHTAILLLSWFVFCVFVLCSGTISFEHSPDKHQGLPAMNHDHGAQQIMHPQEALTSVTGDCESQSAHDMVKLLSSNSSLLSVVASMLLVAFSFLLPLLYPKLSFVKVSRFRDPPSTGYPPLFLTTQRLLN